MIRILIALALATAFLVSALTPVACVEPGVIPFDPRPTATSAAECQTACSDLTYQYAYFDPTSTTCGCDLQGPGSGSVLFQDPNMCPDGQTTVYRIVGTYNLNGCAGNDQAGASSITSVSSMEDCFATCGPGPIAAIVQQPGGGTRATFTCGCYDIATFDYTNCNYLVFSHTAGAQISGIYRRRERLRQNYLKAQAGICPRGEVPCLTRPSANPSLMDDYECLDVQTEFESCGGCLYGSHPAALVKGMPFGEDCGAIHGPSMGGISCTAGSCIATSCDLGHALVDGVCVRKRS